MWAFDYPYSSQTWAFNYSHFSEMWYLIVMRGVVCVEQLRAQFVAIVDVNIKTGCPEGLGPVVHGPSTKQTN